MIKEYRLDSRSVKLFFLLYFMGFLCFLMLFAIDNETNNSISNTEEFKDERKNRLTEIPITSYISHAPIYIDGNGDFNTQGWPGQGTFNNPYNISGYSFYDYNGDDNLIDIRNTNVYFEISDNHFNGGVYGVHFSNVSN